MNAELLTAIWRLTRPVNVLIAMASIFLAAFITGPFLMPHHILLACLAGALITAAANTINDYFDVEIDKINKPRRPIPAGRISRKAALRISILEFFMGNILNFWISLPMLMIALAATFLLVLYSAYLKRTALWGNLTVSFISGLAFIYGGMAAGQWNEAIFPAFFAFFFHFGREIIKDIEDKEGDNINFARTFPIRFGVKSAIRLVYAIFIFLMILTALPYFMNLYSGWYFLIILIGVYPVFGYVFIRLKTGTSTRELNVLSNLLKADMLVGLLAIYLR